MGRKLIAGAIVLVLMAVVGGCGTTESLFGTAKTEESIRMSDRQAAEFVRQLSRHEAGPAPLVGGNVDAGGSVVVMPSSQPSIVEHEEESGMNTQGETASMTKSHQSRISNLRLLLLAAGIAALALVLPWAIKRLKLNLAWAAVQKAVAPLVQRIKDLQSRKAETTDGGELTKYDVEIARLNQEIADMRKAAAG